MTNEMEIEIAKEPMEVVLKFKNVPNRMNTTTFAGMMQYVNNIQKTVNRMDVNMAGAGVPVMKKRNRGKNRPQNKTKYLPESIKAYALQKQGKTRQERFELGNALGFGFTRLDNVNSYEFYVKSRMGGFDKWRNKN